MQDRLLAELAGERIVDDMAAFSSGSGKACSCEDGAASKKDTRSGLELGRYMTATLAPSDRWRRPSFVNRVRSQLPAVGHLERVSR